MSTILVHVAGTADLRLALTPREEPVSARIPRPTPTALVLYHYLYPDEVVSSVIFTGLCTGLADRGWRVIASACNRGWKDEHASYPARSFWNGVVFRRIWRPGLRQASGVGRIANALWMMVAWSLMALNPGIRPDVVIAGTDPIFSAIVLLVWRILRPGVQLAHWCFDLYPEAVIAAGMVHERSFFGRVLKHMPGRAYRSCNLIVDIGACMRRRLGAYGSKARVETITPWALAEPEEPVPMDPDERQELFGDAALGLLYSGSYGRAHRWQGIPELARALAPSGGKIVFSVQGNAVKGLREATEKAGAPVIFAPFAPSHRLQIRLGAADVQIVSLREEWTGTVVPSKFFGALAVGRPVLFLGSPDSAIARWIDELHVGWNLTHENLDQIVQQLVSLGDRPGAKAQLFQHCHQVYRDVFSRGRALELWDRSLRGLVLQRLKRLRTNHCPFQTIGL